MMGPVPACPPLMKILLVDDHPLFSASLRLVLEHLWPNAEVQVADSLAAARAALAQARGIELVLLDLSLPDARGLVALVDLRVAAPDTRLVVLSADDRPATIRAVIDAGAAGFIPKTAQVGVMEGALRIIGAGGVYLPAQAYELAPGAGLRAAEHGVGADAGRRALPGAPLTAMEVEVLRQLGAGKANGQIGRELALDDVQLKGALQAIFDKFGVSTRTQAVWQAVNLGVVPPPLGFKGRA